MKKIALITVALALITGCGGQKPADKPTANTPAAPALKKVRVASDTSFPPMEYKSDKQEIVGFDIDLMKEIGKEVGLDPQFISVGWDGIFEGLNTDKYDLVASSVTITDDRKKAIDFTEPYVNAGQIVVAPLDSSVKSFDELKNNIVGTQTNTTGKLMVEKANKEKAMGIKIKAYEDAGLIFEDLANGRVAAVVIDTPVAAAYTNQSPKFKGKFKLVGEPMTEEFYALAVKKGNKELLDSLNKGLAAVKANGKLDELIKKWLK